MHVFRFRCAMRAAAAAAAGRERGAAKALRMKAAKKASKATKVAKTARPRRRAKLAAANQAAAAEAARRARHLKALSGASGAERELEELVFGDSLNVEEDDLLRRLAGPRRVRHVQPRALPGPAATAPVGVQCPPRPRSLVARACSELPAHTAPALVFRLLLQRGRSSRKSPAIRRWKMK